MIFRVSIILLLLLLLQLLFCNSLSFFPSQMVSSVCYYGSGCFLLQISPWCILFRFTVFFDLLLLFSSVPKFHSLRIKVSFSISSSFLQCGISFLMVDLASPCFRFLSCAFSSHVGSFFQSPPPFLQSGIFILHSVLTRSAWLWRRRIDYALSVCSRSWLCSSSILLIISCASIQAACLFVCLCGISELKAAYI
jgi:hypothetical protein